MLNLTILINCSWQTYLPNKNLDFTYEACLFFLYKSKIKNHPAITIMDGPFSTLYPQKKIFFLIQLSTQGLEVSKNIKIVKTLS